MASATAVTTVGAVVGVASGADQQGTSTEPVEAAGTTTLLADIPAGQQVQQASLTEQIQAQSDAADATARQSAEQAARVQAAKDAAAKKKAADAEAKKKAEEAANQGDASASFAIQASYSVAQVQAMARRSSAAASTPASPTSFPARAVGTTPRPTRPPVPTAWCSPTRVRRWHRSPRTGGPIRPRR